MKLRYPLLLMVIIALVFLSACGNQTSTQDPDNAAAIYTQAAETVGANLTMTAVLKKTATSTPSSLPAATLSVTETPLITSTPEITNTSLPPTEGSCDDMAYLSDVTISDGSLISPGTQFIKTWRIKNTGQCTWSTAYHLVYGWASDNWESIKAFPPAAVYLTQSVAPGEEMEISITLTAPSGSNSYNASFRLQNANGYNFGTILTLVFEVEGTPAP
ncbi:NBR1-Ig-like domain-containing protein [Chloroflexota bacterium]